MTRIEDRLRTMFQADAERIQPQDLAPPATFRPLRAQRTGWLPATVAVLSAAAATVALLAGPRLLTEPAATPPGPAAPAPLTITFGSRTTTVTPPGASVAVPVPVVSAADPQVAGRVSDAVEEQLSLALDAFRNWARDAIVRNRDPGQMHAQIAVADTTTWRHYLSMRFDTSTDVGDEHPANESIAVTFDTRTGARVLTTDLFTDVDRAGTLVRQALLASRTDGSLDGFDLAALSLRPSQAGSTPPVNCYPAPAGLHCLLDQGSLAPFEAGRVEATVPWDRLTGLLRPATSD